ncbi:MAG: Mu-like prophage major head subunit gpT family protein [Burkholderiaceae bacterium]|nr:Mu-like prophage major head subunit gpT family protein [Burkholderiaceae bacterium]
MFLTPATILALRTAYSSKFQTAFTGAESILDRVATRVPSSTAGNTYGWLGQWPGFREWVGDRVFKDMAAHAYAVTNKDWESSVAVSRNDIEDDNVGVYNPMFEEMGRAAKVHPDELAFALLKAGEGTLCYDGQNFFDTDHPVYPNVDGTGVATTVSNLQAGAGPAWYLMDVSRAIKPLIFQDRKSPQFTYMTGNDDESVFMRKEYRFGVDSRSNVGFGFWQMAFKSKAALTPANFEAAYAQMASQTTDGGRVMGLRATVLVVPPNLRAEALAITKADLISGGETNVNAGLVETIVTPWVL